MKINRPLGNWPAYIINSVTDRCLSTLERIDIYVCRPLNGKHNTTILCVLCGSAVKNAFLLCERDL